MSFMRPLTTLTDINDALSKPVLISRTSSNTGEGVTLEYFPEGGVFKVIDFGKDTPIGGRVYTKTSNKKSALSLYNQLAQKVWDSK